MRGKTNLPVFIGYGLISLLTLGYLASQMGGEFFMQSTYRVKAVFATGAQLVTGDDVTINGLRVGKIESIVPDPAGGAAVTLLMHSQYAPVYHDAHAVVKSKNLLGETYVEVARGAQPSGPLADGGVIPKEQTLTPVEVSRILDTLDGATRDRLVLLINNLGAATAGNGVNMNISAGDLKTLAQDLQVIATTIATSSQRVDALITGLRKILQTLAAWHTEFRALITDWDRLMRTLASRESDLEGTIRQNSRVMAIFDQALSGNAAGSLNSAIRQGPSTLDSADHYLSDGSIVYGQLAANTDSISSLFYELASVMSGIDPATGQHMWRVYQVTAPNDVAVQCNPYITQCGPPAGGTP